MATTDIVLHPEVTPGTSPNGLPLRDTRDPQVIEKEYDSTVRADIELFRSQAASFLAGDLTDDQLRPHRLRRGIYSQRQAGVQMIRTKVPGGLLTAAQMRQL